MIKLFKKVKKPKKLNKVYYLICTDNLVESLRKIRCGIDINRILENRSILKNRYIYIGTKFGWNTNHDWDWRPLENIDNWDEYDKFFDGKCVYEESDYIFQGYNNLTNEQRQDVENIRERINMINDIKKYNL